MKWDGKSFAEYVKENLYTLLVNEIPYASKMENKEYADFLKSKHKYSSIADSQIDILAQTSGITITLKDVEMMKKWGSNLINLTWSMAARHIRAWEFEKRQAANSVQNQWDNTHLCGTKINSDRCEHFLETGSEEKVLHGRKLDKWCYYCTSENKVRKIGSGGTWTGLSPKFCPKRKALEEKTMCDDCINNDESCIKPSRDICNGYTSKNDTIFNSAAADNKEENTMGTFNLDAFISQQGQLKQISIDLLVPYHNHKFKLYDGERLEDMVNSIKANGVLTPIIVRPAPNDEGKYEILAGHNRCKAAKMAGLTTVPGVIKEGLSDEDSEMYVIETNTMQRGFGDLSVSEQAAVIAMRHSRMFDPAKRAEIARELTDLDNTDGEDTEKKSKLAITGEEYSLSKNTVARLIRVNALLEACDKFTFAVNTKKDLSVRAAVELSYIPKTALEVIFEKYKTRILENQVWQLSVAISMSTAEWLREVFTDFRGTKEQAQKMLDKENVEKTRKEIDSITAKPIKISIPSDTFRKYFNAETKPDEAADIIDKALQMYFSQKPTPTEEKSDNVSIEKLDISERTLKALKTQRINTVAELKELMDDKSTAENILGIKVVEEILEVLELEDD